VILILLGYDTALLTNWFPIFPDNIMVSSSRAEMSKNNAIEQVDAGV
jgi:hypothetical protein